MDGVFKLADCTSEAEMAKQSEEKFAAMVLGKHVIVVGVWHQ